MTKYVDYQVQLHPPDLQRPNGEAWGSAFGVFKDAFVEAAIAAVKCRFLTSCPPDALAYIGQERNLGRFPSETTDAYRARLLGAWDAWKYAGTKTGIVNAIVGLGLSNVTVKENVDWSWPPSQGYAPGAEWWRFWVLIGPPHPWTAPWTVGDGTKVGMPPLGSGRNVGMLGPTELLAAVKASIQKWKPAHALCTNLVISLGGSLIGDGRWTIGDGTKVGNPAIYSTVEGG